MKTLKAYTLKNCTHCQGYRTKVGFCKSLKTPPQNQLTRAAKMVVGDMILFLLTI